MLVIGAKKPGTNASCLYSSNKEGQSNIAITTYLIAKSQRKNKDVFWERIFNLTAAYRTWCFKAKIIDYHKSLPRVILYSNIFITGTREGRGSHLFQCHNHLICLISCTLHYDFLHPSALVTKGAILIMSFRNSGIRY